MEKTRLLIVGGGPAGYTAAIYASRASLAPVLYEGMEPGGQLTTTTVVENYPGFPEGVEALPLMDGMRAQALRFGADIRRGVVMKADLSARPFRITVDNGDEIETDALIIATGATARYLGLPSELAYRGRGVSACATCDGFFYRKKVVAVVGGGDTALQDALFLANTCRSVTVVVRRDRFRGEAALARRLAERENVSVLFSTRPVGYALENGALSGLIVENGEGERTLPVAGVFLAVGQEPCSAAFAGLAETDSAGYFAVGENCRSTVPGGFVAGDCRAKEIRQLTTAVGDGAVAALAACAYLDAQHVGN